MGHLNERGWINVATLVVYLPLLVGTLATLLRQGFRLKSFYYLLVFVLVKYVGAAMTIDVQLKNNASLYTPAAILSTIVLTPLIMSVGGIVSLKTATSPDQKPLITSRTTRLTHLSHLAVLASLALGIVGGLDVFSTTPDPNSNGKTYMRAAAGLAAGALFLIAVVVATNMANARLLGGWYVRLYTAVAFVALPLLAARVAYTVGVAATVDTTRTQVFNPLTGSWVLYLCLAWLPEVLLGYVLVAVGLMKPRS
ncbi:hypothetical protein B0J12DRAFT_691562 [Macrophomina phaseolina]|uniref:DUF7702 domain-containing protein n=1 Tax=Macrophomina phaseolina TaxID=35725 RepID=A0ABQ8FPX9_9PEZI|nr:hypothetical protein B0J12DRAFT_691562 [Macrophomina phaseolina]